MKNLKSNKNEQPQTLVQLYRIKFEVSIRLFVDRLPVTFTIENGKYTTTPSTANSFKSYTEKTSGYVENKVKLQNKSVLLTTGANPIRNSKMNIYDIAGNQSEFTLEKSAGAGTPCTIRGSFYSLGGSYDPASIRRYNSTTRSNSYNSFRSALY